MQRIHQVIILLLILLLTILTCHRNKPEQVPVTVFDTIRTIVTTNQYGDTVYKAQTSVIEAQAKDLKRMSKLLASKDSALAILSKAVTNQTQSATYYNTVTEIRYVTDTVQVDSNGTYSIYIMKRWYQAKMSMDKDSAELFVRFDNPFIVQHNYTKKGLMVEVTPLNPYCRVTELKSFAIPKPRHSIDLSLGVLVTNQVIGPKLDLSYRYKRVTAIAHLGVGLSGPWYGASINYSILRRDIK